MKRNSTINDPTWFLRDNISKFFIKNDKKVFSSSNRFIIFFFNVVISSLALPSSIFNNASLDAPYYHNGNTQIIFPRSRLASRLATSVRTFALASSSTFSDESFWMGEWGVGGLPPQLFIQYNRFWCSNGITLLGVELIKETWKVSQLFGKELNNAKACNLSSKVIFIELNWFIMPFISFKWLP